MDVIALAQAGFAQAVAPLGTALTEDQLELLWRISSEPILCFDGDQAGIKAAHRAIDLALPSLKPGRSLRFAVLPEGKDPDDLVKASGPQAGAAPAPARDKVEINSVSAQLAQLEKVLSEMGVVDSARVESIKQAISEGRFRIDSDVVADKLLATVREYLVNQKV